MSGLDPRNTWYTPIRPEGKMSETTERDRLRAELERAEAERDEAREQRDYWRGIAETTMPDHPVVAVHTDVLNEVSQRAERAEAERDEAREALERITRLRDRWQAPDRHPVGDMRDPAYAGAAAWAAVGSQADKIARRSLGASDAGS